MPLHTAVIFAGWTLPYYAIKLMVLMLGVALFWLPATYQPDHTLARGYRWITISWALLMVREMMLIGIDLQTPGLRIVTSPVWLDLGLLVIYLPVMVVVGKLFYGLRFQRRSRLSLFLDCLAIGWALMVFLWKGLEYAPQDAAYIGFNTTLLYAMFVIYQQAPDYWRASFRSLALGIGALIISDFMWVIGKQFGAPPWLLIPIYTAAWLIFPRQAQTLPQGEVIYNEDLLYQPTPFQDGLGSIVLIGLASIMTVFSMIAGPVIASTLGILLLLIRIREAKEYTSLQHRLYDAREAERDYRVFLRSLNHDLKAYVTGIRLEADRLANDFPQNEAVQKHVAQIREYHEQLKNRVWMLIDISREQFEGLLIQRYEPAHLGKCTHRLLKNLRSIFSAPHIAISVRVLPSAQTLVVDDDALLRIIENLVLNSIRAQEGQETGEIDIVFDQATVTVSDHGPGPDPLPEPGRRPSILASSGIGLKGAKALAQAMGGSLTINPGPLVGTQAIVHLPTEKSKSRAASAPLASGRAVSSG